MQYFKRMDTIKCQIDETNNAELEIKLKKLKDSFDGALVFWYDWEKVNNV